MNEITDAAMDVWLGARSFPVQDTATRKIIYPKLLAATASTDSTEREWAFEALYRLFAHFDAEQQHAANEALLTGLGDTNSNCFLRVMKGLLFTVEAMTIDQASRLLTNLTHVDGTSTERIRALALELANAVLQSFANNREFFVQATSLLAAMQQHSAVIVSQVVLDPERLCHLGNLLDHGITLKSMGICRNGYKTLGELAAFNPQSKTQIWLWRGFQCGLESLSAGDQIVVVCYLDNQVRRVSEGSMRCQFGDTNSQRLNPIYYKYGLVVKRDEYHVTVAGLRVLDLTLILDIRPAVTPYQLGTCEAGIRPGIVSREDGNLK